MRAAEPAIQRYLLVDEAVPGSGRPLSRDEVVAKCAMTLILWGASIGLLTLGSVLARGTEFWITVAVRLMMALVGISVCYGLHQLLRSMSHRSFRRRAIVAAAITPFVAEAFAWANYFASAWAHGKTGRFVIVDWNMAAQTILLWTFFFVAWTGLYLAIEYSFEARREEQRSAELRTMAQTAKLQALSNQINPHFLFNSLNSISALILDGRSADAERMVAGLSDFLRSTLALDPMVEVTLEQEFELHRRYLAIEQLRYPDLKVEVTLPEALRNAAIPALITQPLVENAIKHGVSKSPPPTQVTISASQEGDMLAVSVSDTGGPDVPRRAAREGIGTGNVRARLAEYFGAAQALVLNPGRGRFDACVTMPLRFRS